MNVIILRIGIQAMLVASLLLGATPAVAGKTDELVLDNGHTIVGEVRNLVQGKVKYKTDQASTIYVEWEYVHFLTSSAFFEVFAKTGEVHYGSLGATAEARQLVVAGEGERVVLSMDDVVRISPIKKNLLQRLDGNVDLGLSYTSADSNLQYSLDAAATYRQPKYSESIKLTSLQTRREGVEDILRDKLSFNYTRYHKKGYFGTGSLIFSRNTELGIDLRTELGYAFGRYFLGTNRSRLSGTAGFSISREKPSGEVPTTSAAWAVLGARYHFFLYHFPKTDIVAEFSVQPSITDWPRTRVNLNLVWRREIIKDFTIGISVYDNYDSEPPEGANAKHDLAVVLSVGWIF